MFAAYSISILKATFNLDAINNLAINRRYFGLSFSISHSVHLVALIYFFYTSNEDPGTVSIIGGGLGYLLMYAMTLTSTDAMVKRIGIKNKAILPYALCSSNGFGMREAVCISHRLRILPGCRVS